MNIAIKFDFIVLFSHIYDYSRFYADFLKIGKIVAIFSTWDAKFQSGKCKEAISDLQQLINNCPNNILISKAYDLLGDYLNYLGEHSQAIQSYEKCLETLDVDNDGQNTVTWINVSIQIARISFQLGTDGPGFSRKSNQVICIPSKMSEDEKQEWINNQLNQSIKYYRQSLTKIPEHLTETKLKIKTELASVLLYTKNFDEAIEIYEIGFHNYGKVEWIYKAAHCLWEQGKKELAYSRLEQLIEADPKYANAYKMLEVYYEEKNEKEKALEAKRKYQFYSWIPDFCQNIEFNEENCSLIETLNSRGDFEYVRTTLANDLSRRSTEFLASICYHHYHGIMDDTAFELIEKRGLEVNEEEKDFIRTVLMYLIQHCTSNCTIRGATSALAAVKHENLFEILAKLIYKDINYSYPMDIPLALAKLEDPRAIPVLINIIEEPIKYQVNDADSSDEEIFTSIGISRLIEQSCFALGSFIKNDENVKQVLINGITNERIQQSCLAVLYISTLEDQYLKQLQQILNDGDTLDYRVTLYLHEHKDKSDEIEKILLLNKEVYEKKKKNKNKKV